MTQTLAVTRRAALPEDEPFLRRVYASTRTDEMAMVPWTDAQKAEFLAMQFHAQHTHYHTYFPDAAYDLLLIDGQPIGRLYLDRRSGDLHVIDIALLPEFRRRGIGTRLIQEILDQARTEGCSVSLYVETFNPALRLYTRLGFQPVEESGIYLFMKWSHDHVCN